MQEMLLPEGVDDPAPILFWRADDFAIFGACYCVGLLANQLIIFLTLGALSTIWMRKHRESQPDGYIRHFLWWHGLMPLRFARAKSPFLREILPP